MAFDLVYEYACVPQDDVYESRECLESCANAGDLACPSFRKYLVQSYLQEEPDPITETCDQFEDWRDKFGHGYL